MDWPRRKVPLLVPYGWHAGLFEVPARTKMDDVAKAMGLSRSTLGEHLRKAELQMLRNSYPFLKLRATRPKDHRDHGRRSAESHPVGNVGGAKRFDRKED